MKLKPILLEQHNNKPFMLQLQQRLIDDYDGIEPTLDVDENWIHLHYTEPNTDDDNVDVRISCELNGSYVTVVVVFNCNDFADEAKLNIDDIINTIGKLTARAIAYADAATDEYDEE